MEETTLNLITLMRNVNLVQIPIIQRDYAQGRAEVKEIRMQFLDSLKDALTSTEIAQPLDLDFVYGNFEGQSDRVFSILDGQQRLTTLFLLHWYFALKDGKKEEFARDFTILSKSKFTYKTRVSASEFFDAITTAKLHPTLQGENLSANIVDMGWFFLSWKNDPTVNACLTMLDDIHSLFSSCPTGIYERLTDSRNPRVVFQFLELENFDLSDELYIKMNARGRLLTDFEKFKAWFCRRLETFKDGSLVECKIDQQWTDLFWALSQRMKFNFDELYLRFFNLMAFFRACELLEGSFEQLHGPTRATLLKLRTSPSYVSMRDGALFDIYDDIYVNRVMVVLDYFVQHIDDTEINVLEQMISTADLVGQTKNYAYIKYIEKSQTESSDGATRNYARWRRVTTNLINNHRIDEMSGFIPSIRSIAQLSENYYSLYESLAVHGIVSGFNRDQREEEQRKAALILSDSSWEQVLEDYERHSYLQGKVGFLLDFATDENDETIDRELFIEMAEKASVVLSDKVLQSQEKLLERALLSLGDYLVKVGVYKFSFCLPQRSTYRERSENWLAVVKKPVFKELLTVLGSDVIGGLEELISQAECGGWRGLVVKHPSAVRYCKNGLVHIQDDCLYLLTKATRKGYHAELRTFVLNEMLEQRMRNGSLPSEILSFRYVDIYGDEYARLRVELSDGQVCNVGYDEDGFFNLTLTYYPFEFEALENPVRAVVAKEFPDEKFFEPIAV
ncbi:DUF262 domain-containing protein [Pseudohongiella acticola]|jgi:Protein of unknown function DUF262|uniref:DUF262 domain-containing protein n=1 Tax=Pseudohongiella acticola TaxID=1524254 RepID=UPI0030EC4AED